MEKRCRAWLSADEMTRATRFLEIEDRRSYIITRGRLRELLGMTQGCRPDDLMFTLGPFGKPRLTTPLAQGAVPFFNLSRTKEHSIIALSWNREIGVDIENIALSKHTDDIAVHFFHPLEREYLQLLSAEQRDRAFVRLWVRKEALAKAMGTGLNMDLSAHDLTKIDEPIECPAVVIGNSPFTTRWKIHDLSTPSGICAALASAETPPSLSPI